MVGQLHDFAEAVGDVENCVSGGREVLGHRVHAANLDVGQRRRGLVENEYLRVADESACEFEQLLLRERQGFDGSVEVDIGEAG